MKNFLEKNPLVHYTIVLTLVAIACGLLIGGINAWTNPIIEQNAYDRKVASYQAVIPQMDDFNELDISDDPSNIEEKVEALNVDGDVIGYIININQTNGYGNLQIVMAINPDGTILSADFLQLNQTLNLDNTRANLQMYVGSNINDQHDFDFLAGATRSLETLTAMMLDIQDAFGNIDIESPVDENAIRLARYQAIDSNVQSFNALDLSTDPASVLVKAELLDSSDAVIGYAIEASVSNSYGLLHIVVVTDETGEIIGAEFVDYGNSMFENQLTAALSNLVGLTMTDDLISGFVVAAPTSPASVPSMEGLLTDVIAAYGHIDLEGAGA